MDEQSDLHSLEQLEPANVETGEEQAPPPPQQDEVAEVEQQQAEPSNDEPVPDDPSMDVDDAAFEDALDSITENPDESLPTAEMSVDEPVKETVSEEHNEEDNDPANQPHAMEIHDVPEHTHGSHVDDPNASVASAEKSMEMSMLNSSAVDPFDAVKETEKEAQQDSSVMESEHGNNDETHDETTDFNESSMAAADENEDHEEPEPEKDEGDGEGEKEKDKDEHEEKEDDASLNKDTEEVADDDVEEIGDGENENVSLLPDVEREMSDADKERARLALEEAEKEKPESPAEAETAAEGAEEEDEPTVDLTEDDPENAEAQGIYYILDIVAQCCQCKENKACQYRLKKDTEEPSFFCSQPCVDAFIAANADTKYVVRRKKYVATESQSTDEHTCNQCDESKVCKYVVQQEDEEIYLCEEECLNVLLEEQADRIRVKKAPQIRVRDFAQKESMEVDVDPEANKFNARTDEEQESARLEREQSFVRHCAQCALEIQLNDKTLNWETMDFCSETCVGQYQQTIGSTCTTCHNTVPMTSMGKYCVRFGLSVCQFCRNDCLTEFKKGMNMCTYCQNNISPDEPGFCAPVGEKGPFKNFCSQNCMKKYEEVMTPVNKRKVRNAVCSVCQLNKPARVQVSLDDKELSFCTNACLSAFKFVNNVVTDECGMCSKHFERKAQDAHTLYPGTTESIVFCNKLCMNIYITSNRKIVPCSWCKVKKYNFDMIRNVLSGVVMCSLNCLRLCEVSVNAMHMKRFNCDQCKAMKPPQYHLTMSDSTMRNFCTYQCTMAFQNRYKTPVSFDNQGPVPTGLPKRVKKNAQETKGKKSQIQSRGASRSQNSFLQQFSLSRNYGDTPQRPQETHVSRLPPLPLITGVRSLASFTKKGKKGAKGGIPCPELRVMLDVLPDLPSTRVVIGENGEYLPPRVPPPRIEYETRVVQMPREVPEMSNMSVQCNVITEDQEVYAKPEQESQELQTDPDLEDVKTCIVPVPIYVPTPIRAYAMPRIVPKPFILPIPVPVFIPITKSTANSVMRIVTKNKKVDVAPADPFEAELLMMAEAVAGAEAGSKSTEATTVNDNNFDNPQFNEDLVQMALKMATNDYDMNNYGQQDNYGRKRPQLAPVKAPSKRIKSEPVHNPHHMSVQEQARQPTEKPDANMCLKYTFGVNAWKQWVVTKNAELEKSSFRRKPFKNEILQMTADELNYSLCLFVKEVRKPNGSEYAPDTIYYLVLGIQQYLYENGRIDNIFTDPYYERFTDCLDEVARKFSVLYNDSQYIVTRVEEEHLWECKQLGAHSPHVLLSTLMFFNTKHFNLVTPEEHQELSFSHIMKHWKRNPGQGGKGQAQMQGTRNVMLRFYPPQASLANNARKKKVYEQSENEENPLRCPVKLYEFYLSKCPESVKTRNDVFYLQPERSCVPDSPVWYSTQPMSKEGITKMLHRVKMVKEINIALLTS